MRRNTVWYVKFCLTSHNPHLLALLSWSKATSPYNKYWRCLTRCTSSWRFCWRLLPTFPTPTSSCASVSSARRFLTNPRWFLGQLGNWTLPFDPLLWDCLIFQVKTLLYLADLLEMCQFKVFWQQIHAQVKTKQIHAQMMHFFWHSPIIHLHAGRPGDQCRGLWRCDQKVCLPRHLHHLPGHWI